VVDDFEPFRRFLRSILQKNWDCRSIVEASDGAEAVELATELQPDLILLDIGLPTLNGLAVAQRLSHKLPGTKILFVSANRDASVIDAALSNGGKGFVLKTDAASELSQAIAAVLNGEVFVSNRIKRGEVPVKEESLRSSEPNDTRSK